MYYITPVVHGLLIHEVSRSHTTTHRRPLQSYALARTVTGTGNIITRYIIFILPSRPAEDSDQ
jgi:hypothetical protein